MLRAVIRVLPVALVVLGCAGDQTEAEDDPLAGCAENLESCYASCPRPTWVLMASAPGHICATGRAARGGRQHSRAIDSARERLAGSVERLGRGLAAPLQRALAPTLAGAASIGVDAIAGAIAAQFAADARLTSRVAQVYEDCITGEVYVMVAMDPQAQVETALRILTEQGRAGGLFLMGREAEALRAAREVLEDRITPAPPPLAPAR